MKAVSENIKNALRQPTTQRKSRILVNNNYYEIYNVKYYADSYEEGNVIGTATATQLNFDMEVINKFNEFKYFEGIWTGQEYEYIDMGTFTVFDEVDEDGFNLHITAFDNLIKFNAPFQNIGIYPKTLYEELQNICSQAGITLKNLSIPNGTFKVVNNQFVNGENLKSVLKAICQISGTYAIIKDDKLVLQLISEETLKIEKKEHEPVIWKRRTYGINQVIIGLEDVIGEYAIRQDLEDIEKNGVHKLVINDNPFAYTQAKRVELIDSLFEQVKGFGYIPYEMNSEWLPYSERGDKIIIDDIETILLRIDASSPNALETTFQAPAVIDSAVTYIDNTESIENQLRRTEIIVDKQNQTIESVVEQTSEQNQKISQVTQTVDELNSKIGDIADITISGEDTTGKVELSNINQSEPIRIVIRPIGESISYDYPQEDYPQEDYSKIRVIKFHNLTTDEEFVLEIPDDLLYLNSEIYDEFILDYDSLTCVINKKLEYNEDGSIGVLTAPYTEEFEYTHIELTDGDYKIEVLGYDTAYLFVRLMAQNIYTTQFATRAELNSEITQTNNTINLGLSQKLDGEEFTGANILLQINEDKSMAQIKANKISLEGKDINLKSERITIDSPYFSVTEDGIIKSIAGEIGGFTLSENNLEALITSDYDYTEEDTQKIMDYYLGLITLTDEEKIKYDIDKDGKVTLIDAGFIQTMINAYVGKSTPGKFIINANSPTYNIIIENGYGEKITRIGLDGIETNKVKAEIVEQTSLEEKKKDFERFEGALSIIDNIDIYKYHLINENENRKKHIGFVIGKDYKYSEEITTENNDGVDLYAMASLCLQAIKEQKKIINDLQNEIKKIKEENNDKN